MDADNASNETNPAIPQRDPINECAGAKNVLIAAPPFCPIS
jgi:hypothetical protein